MKFFLFAVMVLASACSTTKMVEFRVESEPSGAQVDINGVSAGFTPTSVSLKCGRHFVGYANSSDGYGYDYSPYNITVYPSKDLPGESQSKLIDACQMAENGGGTLRFDLGLQRIQPKQRVDLEVSNKNSGASGSIDETIRKLKDLRDQGVLTDSEYKKKVKALIKDRAQ